MRQKLYYTTDEITPDLFTTGSEFMTADSIEYTGAYHTYSTGEIYSGDMWDSKTSKKLIPFVSQSTTVIEYKKTKNIVIKYDQPVNRIVQITPTDIQNGYVQRYFLKKINEPNILEVDADEYSKYESNLFDPILYSGITFKWWISGPLNDNTDNGVYDRGVITKNELTLQSAEMQMPGISNMLNNYSEYYMSDSVIVPKDING